MKILINKSSILGKNSLPTYLRNECRKELEILGKTRGWLSFAKRGNISYKFLKNKDKQFEILDRIFKKASGKYRNFRTSQIADTLSEIVNSASYR